MRRAPLRLLLSSPGSAPYGAERVLLALAGGLRERGHSVALEFPIEGPAVEAARADGLEVIVTGRPRLPRNPLETAQFIFGIGDAVARLRRVLREGGPYDAVWVNSYYNPWAAVAARSERCPVVWHLHERALGGAAGLLMSTLIGRLADVAAAPSASAARTHGRRAGPIAVLPNALLRGWPAPPPLPAEAAPYLVACVGQLEPGKRPVDLIAAVARLDGVEAVLVGGGKRRAEVEAAIGRHGVADRVRLVGYQPDPSRWLHQAGCVAIPAVGEAFGLVALEAMAAGRPVVAADSGALPEVLGDAALYFRPGDVAGLAGQIERLRTDPGLARRLREAGLVRVREFGLESQVDRAEELLRRAMTHGR